MNKRELERIAAEAFKRNRRNHDDSEDSDDSDDEPRDEKKKRRITPEHLRQRQKRSRRTYDDSDDSEYDDPTIPKDIWSVRTKEDMRKFKAYQSKQQKKKEDRRRQLEQEAREKEMQRRQRLQEAWEEEMNKEQRKYMRWLKKEREKRKEEFERERREDEAMAEMERRERKRRIEENIRRYNYENERRDRERPPRIEYPDEDEDDYLDIPHPPEPRSIPANRQEFVRKTPNGNEYVVLSQTRYAPSPYETQNYERQLDAIKSHDQEITERKRIQAENQKRFIDANEKIIERDYDYRLKRDQISAGKETALEAISHIRDIDSGRNERLRLQLEHEERMKKMEMDYRIARERRAAAIILQNLEKPKFLPLNERRERNAQLVREKYIYQALVENDIDPQLYDPVKSCAVVRFHLQNENPNYSHSVLWCGVETFEWDQSAGVVYVRFTNGNGSQTDLKIEAKGLYPSLVYNGNYEKIMSFYKYGGATTPWDGVYSNQQQRQQPEPKNFFQRLFALK